MYVLNEQQISFILEDIRRNGIEMEELQLSLLDHICCIVENEMPPDKNFNEFYRSIIPRFFKRELREIQEETNLLLTFKHYYAMKNIMIKSGAISAIGIVTGSIFKIMHWPGASALILLSVACISFVFLPILYVLKARETNVLRDKAVLGIGTLIGILFCVSTLFKIMHWPGANIMWLCCLGILFFLFLPIYFFGGIRNPDTKVNTIVSSLLILFAGGMLFALTNLRSSRWMDYVYANANQSVYRSYAFVSSQNSFTQISDTVINVNVDILMLNKKCNAICEKIEAIKKSMVERLNNNLDPKLDQKEMLQQYAGNYDVTTNYLFSENGQPKTALKVIKQDLNDVKTLLEQKFGKKVDLLNTADTNKFDDPEEETITWEEKYFYHVPYDLVVKNLTQLQLDLRLVQASCLK